MVDDYSSVDWETVYILADAHGVTGFVTAGIERSNAQLTLETKLQFIGTMTLLTKTG